MGCNDLLYVRHAAVAKLQSISVKNLVKVVICQKSHSLQEFVTDVCSNINKIKPTTK